MARRVEATRLSVFKMNQKWNEAKSNAIESFAHCKELSQKSALGLVGLNWPLGE